MTQVCGELGLEGPRDAFLSSLVNFTLTPAPSPDADTASEGVEALASPRGAFLVQICGDTWYTVILPASHSFATNHGRGQGGR